MERRVGNTTYTTSYNSEPIRKLKLVFYLDIAGTIIYILHWIMFWPPYPIPFDIRKFLGILCLILTIGLCVFEFLMVYKKAISGLFLNQNLVVWTRVGVWALVFLYSLLLMFWATSNVKGLSALKFSFRMGYYLMFVVMLAAILLLVATVIFLNNVKRHNLSLAYGRKTHVVRYQNNGQ